MAHPGAGVIPAAGRPDDVGGDVTTTLVVDGMNVVGARPDGWWRDRDAAVRRLAAALARLVARDRGRVVLVLDGRPLADLPEGEQDGVEVRYARRSGADAADDRIVELVRTDPAVEVVTADRALRDRVTALGAYVSGPATLWTRLDEVDPTSAHFIERRRSRRGGASNP